MKEFYIGSFTPNGFKTCFDAVNRKNYYTKLIKGIVGKERLLQAAALKLDDYDIYYGFDGKIAAVSDNSGRVIYADGDKPYTHELLYPLIQYETIDLDSGLEKSEIQTKKELAFYEFDEYYKYIARIPRYLSALEDVCGWIYQTACNGLDTEKLEGFISRFTRKNIVKNPETIKVSHTRKQLSALTSNGGGYGLLIPKDAAKIFYINDPNFAGADYLIKKLAEIYRKNGYSTEISHNFIFTDGVSEHLIIPRLRTAFVTVHALNSFEKIPQNNVINFARFYNKDVLRERTNRLVSDKKSARALLSEAAASLRIAAAIKERIEMLYSKGAGDREWNL